MACPPHNTRYIVADRSETDGPFVRPFVEVTEARERARASVANRFLSKCDALLYDLRNIREGNDRFSRSRAIWP